MLLLKVCPCIQLLNLQIFMVTSLVTVLRRLNAARRLRRSYPSLWLCAHPTLLQLLANSKPANRRCYDNRIFDTTRE